VEMPSPLSGQSGVEILVRTSEMELKIHGQVLATHPLASEWGCVSCFVIPSSARKVEIMNDAASPQFKVAKVGKLLQSEKCADTNPSHQSSSLRV
jgi:hypothetical protein